jgi:hypothetical protein
MDGNAQRLRKLESEKFRTRLQSMIELTTRTLRLPYVPATYPDEILGSWLTRVAINLGGGAWRTLLEEVGFDRRMQSDSFDMVDYDERMSDLLCLLGTTYESTLLKLTTLPYWLTFVADSSPDRLPGTSTIPAPLKARGGAVASIRLLGSRKPQRETLEARYCPECLSYDYRNVGQPYWHRAHQLPNVHFCHKHHCELRTNCPRCGVRPIRGAKRMLSMPRTVCQCGTRLDVSIGSRTPTPQELSLISVSVRALNQEVPAWDRRHVFAYFQSLLANGARSSRGRYQVVLSDTFSKSGRTDIVRSNGRLASALGGRLRFKGNLSMASAPECCALLVALGVDFDSAISGFRENASGGIIYNPRPPPVEGVMTVHNSRLFLLQAKGKYRLRPASAHRRHYWYLRLNDPEWLFSQFPESINNSIPSIASDRVEVAGLLHHAPQTGSWRRAKAKDSAAGLRAQFRDMPLYTTRSAQPLAQGA